MSIPSPLQQYHFHVNLIWWHSPFNDDHLFPCIALLKTFIKCVVYQGNYKHSNCKKSRVPRSFSTPQLLIAVKFRVETVLEVEDVLYMYCTVV